jgi:hypothetical protein
MRDFASLCCAVSCAALLPDRRSCRRERGLFESQRDSARGRHTEAVLTHLDAQGLGDVRLILMDDTGGLLHRGDDSYGGSQRTRRPAYGFDPESLTEPSTVVKRRIKCRVALEHGSLSGTRRRRQRFPPSHLHTQHPQGPVPLRVTQTVKCMCGPLRRLNKFVDPAKALG